MLLNEINWFNSPRFIRRPLFAEQTRIKRKPPRAESEDSKPGYLCWGQVGDLPTAEPVSTTGFNTEKHTEISRETDPVEIVNPDDPNQKVNALQTKKMKLEKTVPAEKNNSATKDAELDEGGWSLVEERVAFTAAGQTQTVREEWVFNPPERAL